MQRLTHFLSRPILVIGGFILFSIVWGSLIGPIRGFEGAILAGLVAFGFFLGVVLLAGPHVLPIDPNNREQVSKARKTLLRFAIGKSTLMAVVREGNVMPGPDGRSRENASGQGVIDVDSTSVVILATDTKLSRIEGPGVIFTNKDEHIRQVVDLRIQNRKEEVDLVTRDGIQVRVSVSVRFQIDKVEPVRVQDEQPATRWPMPYRWTQRTVSRALEQQRVGPNGPVLWDFIVLDIAVAHLRTIVAEYAFDGLSAPLDPRANPRRDIRSRLEREVRNALSGTGIRLDGMSLGVFFPRDFPSPHVPSSTLLDKITLQRVHSWQAEWHSRMMTVDAEGKAERERRHRLAWSQAQMELIMRVTQALESGASTQTEATDQIALRFMKTLSKIADESGTRAMWPHDAEKEEKPTEKGPAKDEHETPSES